MNLDDLDLWTDLGQLNVHIAVDEIRVFGPGSSPESPEVRPDARAIREWTRVDDRGRYRPLPGALTVRSNWQARFPSLAAFTEAVSEVYPLVFEHTVAWQEGRLRVVGLDDVLSRQSGRYEVAAEADDASRRAASATLCAGCVKRPVWREDQATAPQPGETAIPCPEPCSVLVSLCREAAVWQREPPRPAPVNQDIAYAAFDEPGNAVREAYLRARYGGQREQ